MIDNIYRNSFREVFIILENTDIDLLSKIPTKFINFIKDNMNPNYKTNISTNIDIDKQCLLKETEAIIALIYRSYWASDEEKKLFAIIDSKIQNHNKIRYQLEDVYKIFEKKKNVNTTSNTNLPIVYKKNFLQRFFDKLISVFKNH